MQSTIEKRRVINSALPLDNLVQTLPAKSHIGRMAKRMDQVPDLQLADEDLAAIAANDAVAPNTRIVGDDRASSTRPKSQMFDLTWMNMDFKASDSQIAQDRAPEVDADFIIVAAERETPKHLKIR